MTDPQQLAQFHFDQGIALARQGHLDDAAAAFSEALRWAPGYVQAYCNLGTIRTMQQRWDEAAAFYQQAVYLEPSFADSHFGLGVALQQLGRTEEAATSFEDLLRNHPDRVDAWNNLGNLRKRLDDASGAIACYQEALKHKSDCPFTNYNLAKILADQGRSEDAIVHYRRAIELKPDYYEACENLSNIFLNQGNALVTEERLDEALVKFETALSINPRSHPAYHSLAMTQLLQGRFEDAMASFQNALAVKPDYAEVHLQASQLRLLRGDFRVGWAEYEWRYHMPDCDRRFNHVPCWDGAPLDQQTILLQSEQGLGDTIQFLRYASLVRQRGGWVVLECYPALVSLAATCPGIDLVVPFRGLLPAFDVRAPLMSLPRVFGTDLRSIPGGNPYLTADPALVTSWHTELANEPGLKVGLVWHGNPQFKRDRHRSIPLAQFAPLADVPGIRLFSLQIGPAREQLTSVGFPITDLGSRFDPNSLADLAAVLVNLDLLVSVDTAPAHLAGALGVPVWIALSKLPDWRWLLDRSDSPWYPTARLFRQQYAGNWSTVFAQMAMAMEECDIRPREALP